MDFIVKFNTDIDMTHTFFDGKYSSYKTSDEYPSAVHGIISTYDDVDADERRNTP
jgi:hypothetical protein